jgi:hypothetical protein
MQTAKFAGIVLAVVGIGSLAYREISYTIPSEPADAGSLQVASSPADANVENQSSFGNPAGGDEGKVTLAPVLGGVLLVGGVALLASTSHASSGRHL